MSGAKITGIIGNRSTITTSKESTSNAGTSTPVSLRRLAVEKETITIVQKQPEPHQSLSSSASSSSASPTSVMTTGTTFDDSQKQPSDDTAGTCSCDITSTTPISEKSNNINNNERNDINDITQQLSRVFQSSTSPPKESIVTLSITMIRNHIFHLLICMGQLASHFVSINPSSTAVEEAITTSNNMIDHNSRVRTTVQQMIRILMQISQGLAINLYQACINKVQLNERKYPIELCKGKAAKYTEYSQQTGITKTIGQSTVRDATTSTGTGTTLNSHSAGNNIDDFDSSNGTLSWADIFVTHSIPHLQQLTRQFAIDRDWIQYHTPRNIALALSGEIGELAELFQFLGDDVDHHDADDHHEHHHRIFSDTNKMDKISQELADVTIYICRLSDVCQVSI